MTCAPGNLSAAGTCDCPWPWASGDMVPLGSSCLINLEAIRIMWAVDAGLLGLVVGVVARDCEGQQRAKIETLFVKRSKIPGFHAVSILSKSS